MFGVGKNANSNSHRWKWHTEKCFFRFLYNIGFLTILIKRWYISVLRGQSLSIYSQFQKCFDMIRGGIQICKKCLNYPRGGGRPDWDIIPNVCGFFYASSNNINQSIGNGCFSDSYYKYGKRSNKTEFFKEVSDSFLNDE